MFREVGWEGGCSRRVSTNARERSVLSRSQSPNTHMQHLGRLCCTTKKYGRRIEHILDQPTHSLHTRAPCSHGRCYCRRLGRSYPHRYLKGWFLLDAVSSLPVALVVHYVDVSGLGVYFYILKLVSCL